MKKIHSEVNDDTVAKTRMRFLISDANEIEQDCILAGDTRHGL